MDYDGHRDSLLGLSVSRPSVGSIVRQTPPFIHLDIK